MPVIAPWLQPTDVLGAMRSGAGLGLQLRQQSFSEDEAIARRQQAAEEFAGRQQQAAESLAVERESGAARLALAASNAAAQAGYHKESAAARSAAQSLREKAENRMQQHQTFLEEQAKKTLTGPVEGTPVFFEGKPVPGMFGTPSAGGKSFNLHRIPQEKSDLTPFQNASLTKWKLDAAKGLATILPTESPEYTNALTRAQELTTELLNMGKKAPSAATDLSPQQGVDFMGIIEEQQKGFKKPPAPRNPKEREVGTVYETPKGNLKWTGTGWIQP